MTLKIEDFEPVAEIIRDWIITFIGCGPIAPIVRAHGLVIGDRFYTASQMQQVIDQCNAKDETLKDHGEIQKSLCDQLAAAQADNERLRESLAKVANIENRDNCGDWDEIEEARNIAKEALATTSPTDVLREHDAKLVERIDGIWRDNDVDLGIDFFTRLADKIRKGEFK